MMRRMTLGTGAVLIATLAVSAHAQDRLKAMPGDSNFIAMAPDGSALFIASDQVGKIWRVVPTSSR